MNIITYIMILLLKIIENALATLRIIVIAHGRKKIGAVLNFLIALVWVFVTGTVIINLNKDPLKIIFFALGSLLGSYLGSILEEKIAMGENVLIIIINKTTAKTIKKEIKNYNKITSLNLTSNNRTLLMITLPRKLTYKISKIIKTIDPSAIILSEKVKIINSF